MNRALITGITGQDGSYLAEFLLSKGYDVFGFARQDSWYRPNCSSHLSNDINVIFGDMIDGVEIACAVQDVKPTEVYNLASQSRPGESWGKESETLLVNALGATRLFEAVRHFAPDCRVYHASSSEMFGTAQPPQNEKTSFQPVNPYAAAKVYAHNMARIYRESYGLFISCGILFNHESERRPLHFLTQKVAYGAACASLGIRNSPDLNERGKPIVEGGLLLLGNLNVRRDWGYAGDFVRAMWLMLQEKTSDDYVIGTGTLRTLTELCEVAYGCVGLDFRDHISTDTSLVRPTESGDAIADSTKARKKLGWEITVNFEEMLEKMVNAQIARLMSTNYILKQGS